MAPGMSQRTIGFEYAWEGLKVENVMLQMNEKFDKKKKKNRYHVR